MSDELDRRRRRSEAARRSRSSGWHDGATDPARITADDAQTDGRPLDLGEVQFDDSFLDALSQDRPTPTRDDAEYQLAGLLSGWRHDVLAEPAPEPPSADDVERAMAAAQGLPRRSGRFRGLKIAAGAAAVAVVAAVGVTVMSQGAHPGDPLWDVKKVVFAQQASETQASHDVRSDLEQAETALAAGDMAKAKGLIARAESKLGPVRDHGTRTQMSEWIDRLRQGAEPKPSATGGAGTEPTTAATSAPTGQQTVMRTTPPETTKPDPRMTNQLAPVSPAPSSGPSTSTPAKPTSKAPVSTPVTTTTTTPAG